MKFFATKYCYSLCSSIELQFGWCLYAMFLFLVSLPISRCLYATFYKWTFIVSIELSLFLAIIQLPYPYVSHSYGICYFCQEWKIFSIWATRFMFKNDHGFGSWQKSNHYPLMCAFCKTLILFWNYLPICIDISPIFCIQRCLCVCVCVHVRCSVLLKFATFQLKGNVKILIFVNKTIDPDISPCQSAHLLLSIRSFETYINAFFIISQQINVQYVFFFICKTPVHFKWQK